MSVKRMGFLSRRVGVKQGNRRLATERPAYSQRAQPKSGDTIRILDPRTRQLRDRPVLLTGIIVAVDSPLVRYGSDQGIIYRLPDDPQDDPRTRIAMPQDVLFEGEGA